jgi:hypothetical protein
VPRLKASVGRPFDFMNLKQLERQLGTNLKLRPAPIRIAADGQHAPSPDEEWKLDAILIQPNRVRLTNIASGLSVELQTDNIKEYRSPEFLMLRCQLTMTAQKIELEPDHTYNETFKRLEMQMPALMSEMRKDLALCPLRREVVILKRSWNYLAKGNELLYYTDDHPELLSQFQILLNTGSPRILPITMRPAIFCLRTWLGI